MGKRVIINETWYAIARKARPVPGKKISWFAEMLLGTMFRARVRTNASNFQTAVRILSNPTSRSAFRSSMSARWAEKRKAWLALWQFVRPAFTYLGHGQRNKIR